MDLVPGALFVALSGSEGGGPRGAGFHAGEVGFIGGSFGLLLIDVVVGVGRWVERRGEKEG